MTRPGFGTACVCCSSHETEMDASPHTKRKSRAGRTRCARPSRGHHSGGSAGRFTIMMGRGRWLHNHDATAAAAACRSHHGKGSCRAVMAGWQLERAYGCRRERAPPSPGHVGPTTCCRAGGSRASRPAHPRPRPARAQGYGLRRVGGKETGFGGWEGRVGLRGCWQRRRAACVGCTACPVLSSPHQHQVREEGGVLGSEPACVACAVTVEVALAVIVSITVSVSLCLEVSRKLPLPLSQFQQLPLPVHLGLPDSRIA